MRNLLKKRAYINNYLEHQLVYCSSIATQPTLSLLANCFFLQLSQSPLLLLSPSFLSKSFGMNLL